MKSTHYYNKMNNTASILTSSIQPAWIQRVLEHSAIQRIFLQPFPYPSLDLRELQSTEQDVLQQRSVVGHC